MGVTGFGRMCRNDASRSEKEGGVGGRIGSCVSPREGRGGGGRQSGKYLRPRGCREKNT